MDLIFPHHENEIAQSESLTGKPFSRFWLHAEFLMVEGQKMSKSLGNYFTLRDILARGYQPEAIRYLLASVPYRKSLNFTFDGLKSAATAIDRLRNFKLRLETDRYPDGVNEQMAARTAAAAQAFTRQPGRRPQHRRSAGRGIRVRARRQQRHGCGRVPRRQRGGRARTSSTASTPSSTCSSPPRRTGHFRRRVEALVAERTAAKKARDFARADQIRQQLLEQGIILEDTKSGVRWKRK